MIPESGGQAEPDRSQAEQVSRLIDLELAEKRARWKEAAGRRQKVRMASYVFLFLLILASLFAFLCSFRGSMKSALHRDRRRHPRSHDRKLAATGWRG